MIQISELWQYPLKSAKGGWLPMAEVTPIGISGDRRLVVLDAQGRFVTARRYPQLLQVNCAAEGGGWLLRHDEAPKIRIIRSELSAALRGTLWKDDIEALDAGDEAAAWLSGIIGTEVRIGVWQERSRVAGKYGFETSFSDASPILVTTEASMQQACAWAGIEPDMRRFRPNIVLDGELEPFVEDQWKQLRIGNAVFEVLDPCSRCILTTRDPDTGDAHPDKQPMKALIEQHASESGEPLFGINVTLARDSDSALISVGDAVTVS